MFKCVKKIIKMVLTINVIEKWMKIRKKARMKTRRNEKSEGEKETTNEWRNSDVNTSRQITKWVIN